MHLVMLSDLESRSGAAIAAGRLAETFCVLGHRVTRLVGKPDGQEHPWTTKSLGLSNWQDMALGIVYRVFGVRVRDRLASFYCTIRLQYALGKLRPDVISVHNLHGAVYDGWSPALVKVCCRHTPTVWTLHDMWSFTGRCAYSYDCQKFIAGCNDHCPTPEEYPALAPDRIGCAWKQRQKLLRECPDLVAVSPSRWLSQEALKELWGGHRVEVIPNGLALGAYKVIDRNLARTALKIETHGLLFLAVADDLTERRKGGEILLEAMQNVSSRPLSLVTLGRGKLRGRVDGVHVCHLGYVDDQHTKVLAYSAADVLIHPAPVDNLPNTVMEAIACGTPVVGFATGGVPEMVRPGETGWLAHEVSPESFAQTIDRATAEIRQGLDLRPSCRAVAEAEYSVELQAQSYSELFESL